MKTNVEKVLERDQKLSELDDRAGEIDLPRSHKPRVKKSAAIVLIKVENLSRQSAKLDPILPNCVYFIS